MWDMLIVGGRLLQFAGALVLLGSCLFQLYGVASPKIARWPQRLLVVSALAAVVGTLLWVMAETVLFSGDPADGTRPAAVWLVFSETRFGRVCLWRIGLLLAALAIAWLLPRTRVHWLMQSALAIVIVATFAWTGHGATTPGWPGKLHLGSDLLHLWSAGIWLGAIVPLAILVRRARRSGSAADAVFLSQALQRFSGIGTAVVAVLVLSGLLNTWFMIGIHALRSSLATAYGTTLLLKLLLFLLMLLLAAANRFWLAPRLQLRALQISILTEAGLALLVLLAVSVLGTLPPPSADG